MIKCLACGQDNPLDASICQSCGNSLKVETLSHALPPKTTLQSGRYIIEENLGAGGFGITYKATDTVLQRPVAIKEFFLYSECIRQGKIVQPIGSISTQAYQESKQAFIQEAQLLAKFNHSHIVKVYDFFEENNTAYMVMEFIEGKSLSKLLEEMGGVMLEDEAIRYILQVAEGLKDVHKAGYLHRDINPNNIMVKTTGEAVLIDFGIARQFIAMKTQSMTSLLTDGYAPLEQYGSRAKFGPYTDIYALGATLYHLLTGQTPVSAPDRVHGVELKPPHELNRNVSKRVSDAVMKAMEIEVNKRPQSVDEFIGLLKATEPSFQVSASTSVQVSALKPPLPPTSVQQPPTKPTQFLLLHHITKRIGERFGAVSGALSGAIGGLGVGVLTGLLLIVASAIIGAIIGGLGLAVFGAKEADSAEAGCGAILMGLIIGGVIGYYIGIFIGVILALGASVSALAVGGVKGMQFGMRFGSNLSEKYGAVPTSLILSTITSAIMGIVWSGFVIYAYPLAIGEVFSFIVFVTAIGAVVGSIISSLAFWSAVRKQGGQMPPADRITALVSVPVGMGLALFVFSLAPFSYRWWDVASLWQIWSQKIEYQIASQRGERKLLPSYRPSPTPTVTGFKIRYVQVAQANIRTGPGTNFPVITVVKKGQALKVIGISSDGGWAKVELADRRIGYISRKLLGVSLSK